MSTPSPSATPPPLPASQAAPAARPAEFSRKERWSRRLAAPLKFALGTLFCWTFLGSFVVVGWTYRLAQRIALKSWWKVSSLRSQGISFEKFLAGSRLTETHLHWPNWILQQNFPSSWKSRSRGVRPLIRAFLGSLFLNFKTGVQAVFNTALFILPAGLLWLFSWYDGWNNSFYKGYEQYFVGIGIGWIGILWFCAAMFYVPMAQMRQAVTGNWRAFYQFKLNWSLVRRRWLSFLGLSALYALAAIPITVIITRPMYFANNPEYANVNESEARQILQWYYLKGAIYFFVAFTLLRMIAARIYASALLAAVRRGAVNEEALSKVEWESLQRLNHLEVRPQPTLHPVLRIVAWAGTKVGRAVTGFLIFLAWFALVAQIYIAQFLSYHPVQPWLNPPMVTLPYSDHTPR